MTKKKSRRKKKGPLIQLSRDRQLDLLGIALILIALLTFLSFLSAQQGMLTQAWLNTLERVFGWGMYATPLLIGGFGLYLVLRRFGDRIPWPEPEQIVGVILGFFILLTTFHFIDAQIISTDEELYTVAQKGSGGGYVGAFILNLALQALGPAGVVITLLMGWLVVITFTAGISPAEAAEMIANAIRKRKEQLEAADLSEALAPSDQPENKSKRTARRAKKSKEKAVQINGPAKKEEIEFVIPPLPPGSHWQLPQISEILEVSTEQNYSFDLIRQQVRTIEDTLASLGAPAKVLETNTGPVITQYGVEPLFLTSRSGKRTKVKVGKIASLADDLALALSAKTIRIEAPIPGKSLVGIEVPNEDAAVVGLRDVMESQAFAGLKGALRLGLGQDVSGNAVAADLRAMPHLLIAGATGSGKSVCINATITSLLLQNSPDTLRLLLIDPKRVELTQYNHIPHLLSPVIVDVEKVVPALRWVMREMDSRFRRFADVGARDIEDYNHRVTNMEGKETVPYIVVVVDELADLMMQSADETERVICRLAQMARATGIHLVIATQRPSTDVVTGLIKANFPSRIAFAVASSIDSRVILDTPGAERLLGQGDMLFLPPDAGQPLRLQGTFVSNLEIDRLIDYWYQTTEPGSTIPEAAIPEAPPGLEDALVQPSLFPDFDEPTDQFEDELVPTAVEVLLGEDRASISLLQRRLRIGYTRSARIIDLLTEMGIVTEDVQTGQSRGVNRAPAEALLRSLEEDNDEEETSP